MGGEAGGATLAGAAECAGNRMVTAAPNATAQTVRLRREIFMDPMLIDGCRSGIGATVLCRSQAVQVPNGNSGLIAQIRADCGNPATVPIAL
jgi:hypothetical protein